MVEQLTLNCIFPRFATSYTVLHNVTFTLILKAFYRFQASQRATPEAFKITGKVAQEVAHALREAKAKTLLGRGQEPRR